MEGPINFHQAIIFALLIGRIYQIKFSEMYFLFDQAEQDRVKGTKSSVSHIMA